VATLIDSSVVIEAQRGRLDLKEVAARSPDAELAISAIGAAELLLGLQLMRDGVKEARAEAFVETILADLPIVPFDLLCARAHSTLSADLRRRGAMVLAQDLLITATALARGFTIATSDRRSFPKMPGLEVEIFAARAS
jgi:predicted nucleic acid-binding protein